MNEAAAALGTVNCPAHGDAPARVTINGFRACSVCLDLREQTLTDLVETWQRLGRSGIMVSISFGPSDGGRPMWVVDLVNIAKRSGRTKPIAALDLRQAIEFAEQTCIQQRWIDPAQS
ncbi:MAG: hypothetical protein ACREMT_06200 [Vulcanimicrobiaceae bacterium]